jgi:hypothetical protein
MFISNKREKSGFVCLLVILSLAAGLYIWKLFESLSLELVKTEENFSQVSITGRGMEEKLSAKRDKNHVLFGGTKILQHTPDKVSHVNM